MSEATTTEETTEKVDLSKLLAKVRKLITMAEAPVSESATPEEREATLAEQKRAREMADALMLKAAITDAMIRDAAPADAKREPKTMKVGTGTFGDGAMSWLYTLVQDVAKHCRVKLSPFRTWNNEAEEYETTVYGWDSDISYFEILYTTLRLHMLGILLPKIDPSQSLGDNVFRLHQAGYDYREIAAMYGWKLTEKGGIDLQNQETGEVARYSKIVGRYRKLYYEECDKRGVSRTTIHNAATFREDASHGYVAQMGIRLRRLTNARKVEQAGALVLANADKDLEDYVREQNASSYTRCPHCGKLSARPYVCDRCGDKIADRPEIPECPKCAKNPSGYCRDHPRGGYSRSRDVNMSAYGAGVAHANTADIGGNDRVSRTSTGAIGG